MGGWRFDRRFEGQGQVTGSQLPRGFFYRPVQCWPVTAHPATGSWAVFSFFFFRRKLWKFSIVFHQPVRRRVDHPVTYKVHISELAI